MTTRILLLGESGSGKTLVNVSIYHYFNRNADANRAGFSFLETSEYIFKQHNRACRQNSPNMVLFPSASPRDYGENLKFSLRGSDENVWAIQIESPPGEDFEKLMASENASKLLESGFSIWVANPFRHDSILALHALSGLISHLQLEETYREKFETDAPRNTIQVAVNVLFGLGLIEGTSIENATDGGALDDKSQDLVGHLASEFGPDEVQRLVSLFDENTVDARKNRPIIHTKSGTNVSLDKEWTEVFKVSTLKRANARSDNLKDHREANLVYIFLREIANFACNNPRIAQSIRRTALEQNPSVPVLFTHQDLFARCAIVNQKQALERVLHEVAGPTPSNRKTLELMPFETVIEPGATLDERPIRPSGEFFGKNVEDFLREVIAMLPSGPASKNHCLPTQPGDKSDEPVIQERPWLKWAAIGVVAVLAISFATLAIAPNLQTLFLGAARPTVTHGEIALATLVEKAGISFGEGCTGSVQSVYIGGRVIAEFPNNTLAYTLPDGQDSANLTYYLTENCVDQDPKILPDAHNVTVVR